MIFGQQIIGDSHRIDVPVIYPSGDVGEPVIWLWQDISSGLILDCHYSLWRDKESNLQSSLHRVIGKYSVCIGNEPLFIAVNKSSIASSINMKKFYASAGIICETIDFYRDGRTTSIQNRNLGDDGLISRVLSHKFVKSAINGGWDVCQELFEHALFDGVESFNADVMSILGMKIRYYDLAYWHKTKGGASVIVSVCGDTIIDCQLLDNGFHFEWNISANQFPLCGSFDAAIESASSVSHLDKNIGFSGLAMPTCDHSLVKRAIKSGARYINRTLSQL
jgi:hypothetical protein